MGHLFSSGEILYKENEKTLAEGLLIGSSLEYDNVEPETRFFCVGTIDDKPVKVGFTISDEDYEDIRRKFMFRILMQSDLMLARWKSYEISRLNTQAE